MPNHQTLRSIPLDTRYNVACFGCLGYEFNLCRMPSQELEEVREQVAQYKKHRRLFQYGDFYRIRNDERITQWNIVSHDKKEAVGLIFQKLTVPNRFTDCFKAKGLSETFMYRFTNRFDAEGDLDGQKDNITLQNNFEQFSAGKKKLEKEDCTAYGSALMKAGVMLKQAFAGTGYNSDMRMFGDFASRLYHIKAIRED